jgi:arginine decarboxylase-like protein
MQYKNAILKRDDSEDAPINDLKPGWVKIYYNKNRKLVMEKYDDSNEFEEDFHTCAQRGIQTLIDKWETERLQYNSVYGEGEYERMYYMPRREEDNFSDADSDDGCASVEDATEEECNEDSQYYDLY